MSSFDCHAVLENELVFANTEFGNAASAFVMTKEVLSVDILTIVLRHDNHLFSL
jgi:hypothetical protein